MVESEYKDMSAPVRAIGWIMLCAGAFLVAWYGAAAFLSLLLVSTIITYSLHSYQDILAVLPFAKTETEALAKLPLQRIHIALIMSFPYAGGVIAAAMSRKYLKH